MPKQTLRLNAIKEDLEELMETMKGDKMDLVQFKERQDESFEIISVKIEKLKDELKDFGNNGRYLFHTAVCVYLINVLLSLSLCKLRARVLGET